MSGALRLQEAADWCPDLDEAQVAAFAAGELRRLSQLDAALAAARADPGTMVELVRVLHALGERVGGQGFHALGLRAWSFEDRVLQAAGRSARDLLRDLLDFRGEVAEAFSLARRQVEPEQAAGPSAFVAPPAHAAPLWRQRRLTIAVLEAQPSLNGAAAGTALARAGTHLVCTGDGAGPAYRECSGDGLVLRIGDGGAPDDQCSDLDLISPSSRGSLRVAVCDGAILAAEDEAALADARALLAAGKPVAQVLPRRVRGGLSESGPGRFLVGTDAERAVVALLVELSRDR
jgi:hypothetical protein